MGRHRSRAHPHPLDGYDGAIDIDPSWTREVVTDPDRLVDEPDPRSAHVNSARIVGYSSAAAMVITVVALRDQDGVLHGASAWKPVELR